ncbi:MAG TPA: hypothetical protein VNW50_10710 [Streptosporangiaceae bacterium]|nr:hypothetical protein [Streptosporangiaceae bacterium]
MMELAAATAKSVSAWDEPGTLGFLMVFGMAVILFFVFRSLAKHLRKINEAARLEAAQAEPVHAGTGQAGSGPGSDSPVGPRPVNGVRPTS